MDVVSSTDVTSVTAGKRLSTTLATIRSENVRLSLKTVAVPSIIALTTTGTKIDATF